VIGTIIDIARPPHDKKDFTNAFIDLDAKIIASLPESAMVVQARVDDSAQIEGR
jgi:hypothetical protein